MNTNSQAKNGLKTFIITFSISVLVFSALYFMVSETSVDSVSISDSSISSKNAQKKTPGDNEAVMGIYSIKETGSAEPTTTSVTQATDGAMEEPSVFASLVTGAGDSESVGGVNTPAVLAAAAGGGGGVIQTTQTTAPVPVTGSTSVTLGLLISLTLFTFVFYNFFMNPKSYIKTRFEKKILRDKVSALSPEHYNYRTF